MNKFTASTTAWCPGCGNFGILDALITTLNELQLDPQEVVLVGGIGQAAKTNQYVSANGFSGLHGRALPAAVGIKLANDKLTVIVNSGDGDSYGEGGNHFLHNIRRNVNMTHFVHDNQIYGLTKGQTSPTSDACSMERKNACNMSIPFHPALIAISAGATFVANAYAGNSEHLIKIMKAAIAHNGYALVNIMQPCVTFNKVNTYAYYHSHVYELGEDYDYTDKEQAMNLCLQQGNKIPIGIIYQELSSSYEDKFPLLFDGKAVIEKNIKEEELNALIASYII